MTTVFYAEVSAIGADAEEMFDAGVAIFFGEPCPDALAEVSVVHRTITHPQRDPRPGDVLRVGDSLAVVTQVGSLAGENLTTLGHVVVYFDAESDQQLLPGAIFASGVLGMPKPGDYFEILDGEPS